MIFALATDDGGLFAFPTEQAAVAYCEAIDVEEGNWQFFASDGRRLVARFIRPNHRSRFVVASGHYVLEADDESDGLQAALDSVAYVEGCGLKSITDVRNVLG